MNTHALFFFERQVHIEGRFACLRSDEECICFSSEYTAKEYASFCVAVEDGKIFTDVMRESYSCVDISITKPYNKATAQNRDLLF